MRVGLNLVPIGSAAGGVGRYALELARGLVAQGVDLHAFVGRDAPAELRDAVDGRLTELPVRMAGPPLHLAAQYAAIPALARARRLDVVHSPANAGPWRVPGVATVVTVHDLIWLRLGEAWASAADVAAARRWIPRSARGATRVITDSQDAANDLRTLLGIPDDRIDVVPLAVRPPAAHGDAARARERCELGEAQVVLAVSQKRPYKNLAALVGAVQQLPEAILVLPGAPTPHEAELRALDAAGRVRFPGYVDDAALEDLFAAATCAALPSTAEGFGLGVLEAMARGVPVACSAIGAHREIAGDAALLVEPHEPGGFAEALRRLLGDAALRDDLARRGRERAAAFTWERVARETLAAYERAAAARRRD